MSSVKRPFCVNEIVKARLSFPPSVTAGNYYVVKRVSSAMSYSGWMVAVAQVGRQQSVRSKVVATLDAGYFGRPALIAGHSLTTLLARAAA